MTRSDNPFGEMIDQAREMAKALNPGLDALAPGKLDTLWPTVPGDIMELWFGKAINRGGLDARTRLLLVLAGLTCQGAQADSAIRLATRHAVEAGATRQEIMETICQMSVFAGIPAMTRAMELVDDAIGEGEESPG